MASLTAVAKVSVVASLAVVDSLEIVASLAAIILLPVEFTHAVEVQRFGFQQEVVFHFAPVGRWGETRVQNEGFQL
jgi:hypothetical protein